jgi:hypothetical protein
VTGPQYAQALAEVVAAAAAYHGGVSDDHAAAAVQAPAGSMWTPVYRDLLADLAGALRAAGDRYDRAADAAETPAEQRFDWRSYLPDNHA